MGLCRLGCCSLLLPFGGRWRRGLRGGRSGRLLVVSLIHFGVFFGVWLGGL